MDSLVTCSDLQWTCFRMMSLFLPCCICSFEIGLVVSYVFGLFLTWHICPLKMNKVSFFYLILFLAHTLYVCMHTLYPGHESSPDFDHICICVCIHICYVLMEPGFSCTTSLSSAWPLGKYLLLGLCFPQSCPLPLTSVNYTLMLLVVISIPQTNVLLWLHISTARCLVQMCPSQAAKTAKSPEKNPWPQCPQWIFCIYDPIKCCPSLESSFVIVFVLLL